MKKHFYSHLVDLTSVFDVIMKLNLSDEEREELERLAHENLHTTILDAILSELSEKDARVFLGLLSSDNHQKIWKHLNEKVDGVEDKIQKAADDLKKELHNDLQEFKQA